MTPSATLNDRRMPASPDTADADPGPGMRPGGFTIVAANGSVPDGGGVVRAHSVRQRLLPEMPAISAR